MARHDIMPYTSTMGGHNKIEQFPMETAAAPTYVVGEWVNLTGNEIDELAASNPPFDANQHFVAASDGTQRLDRVGDSRYVDPPQTGQLGPVYVLDQDTEFVTDNYYEATVLTTPTAAIIGGQASPYVVGTVHGIDNAQAGLTITRVLDALGRDVTVSGGTGVSVVFKADT